MWIIITLALVIVVAIIYWRVSRKRLSALVAEAGSEARILQCYHISNLFGLLLPRKGLLIIGVDRVMFANSSGRLVLDEPFTNIDRVEYADKLSSYLAFITATSTFTVASFNLWKKLILLEATTSALRKYLGAYSVDVAFKKDGNDFSFNIPQTLEILKPKVKTQTMGLDARNTLDHQMLFAIPTVLLVYSVPAYVFLTSATNHDKRVGVISILSLYALYLSTLR